MVVLQHSLESYLADSQSQYYVFLETINFGRMGVILFFAISGYLVPWTLFRNKDEFRYVVSRIFRIYPLYWACMLAYWFHLGIPEKSTFFLVLETLILEILNGHAVDVAWTLTIELMFYAAVLFSYKFGFVDELGQRKFAYLFLVTAIISSLISDYFGDKNDLLATTWLALGIMFIFSSIRINYEENPGFSKNWKDLIVCGLVSIFVYHNIHFGEGVAFVSVLNMSTSTIIPLFASPLLLERELRSSLISFFSDISYSIYLIHPLIISLIDSQNLMFIEFFIIIIICTTCLSFGTYKLIEQPMITVGRLVVKKRSLRKLFSD